MVDQLRMWKFSEITLSKKTAKNTVFVQNYKMIVFAQKQFTFCNYYEKKNNLNFIASAYYLLQSTSINRLTCKAICVEH